MSMTKCSRQLVISLICCLTIVNVLIKKNKGNDIFRYAAGGFADFSRLASSDPALWAEIFLTNASEIEAILDAYIKQLTNYKDLLLDKNKDSLAIEFARAKTARKYFMEKHFNAELLRKYACKKKLCCKSFESN